MRDRTTSACPRLHSAWMAIARGENLPPGDRAAATIHAAECARCREELKRQQTLSTSLGAVAQSAPPAPPLPQKLLHAVSANKDRRVATRITAGLLAVAAALVAVLWLRPAHSSPQPAPATLSVTSTFIPLPFARPFRQAEQVGMYRVRMPEAALASYGLPTSGQFAGLEITADVLVGEDGTARAIRFVHTEDLP